MQSPYSSKTQTRSSQHEFHQVSSYGLQEIWLPEKISINRRQKMNTYHAEKMEMMNMNVGNKMKEVCPYL